MNPSTQLVPTSGPIRCLVIQLARLGDTLQSLMALRAAKQLYPNLEIHFVARENFANAAKRVPWIKEVTTLPTESLLGPCLNGEQSEKETIKDLALWIAPLIGKRWDLLINWSFSDASSYLTALIPARVKYGYTRHRKDQSFMCTDGWSHYIQGIVQEKVKQNIHLTDILTTQLLTALQIHAGEPQSDGNAAVTSNSFFSLQVKTSKTVESFRRSTLRWIAIQLGASQESKTWSPQSWAKLIGMILTKNKDFGIVLLGGKADQKKVDEILAAVPSQFADSPSLLSFVGETDFDLWTSTISQCQWLFSGDTAAVHLASVLGIRVLNISVGPVDFSETGPYGNGHYVIRALEQTEGEDPVTPEIAYGTWAYGLHEWAHRKQVSLDIHFAQLGYKDLVAPVQVYRSTIRNPSEGGGVHYEPLTAKGIRIEHWNSMVYGHIARAWYCGWVPQVGQELKRDVISPQLLQILRRLQEPTEALHKVCLQAEKTAQALNLKGNSLKSDKVMGLKDREDIQSLGKDLQELDRLTDRLAKSHPPLLGFSQMSKVLMHNLSSTNLADLGKEASDCYHQLTEGVRIFKEWIKFTLELVRPVALHSAPVASLDSRLKLPGKELSP